VNLPTDLSGSQLGRVLERIGFAFKRQRGSHMIYRRDKPYARVTVPDHKRIRPGTLRQVLHAAGISADQLRELL
jgi:predicted RNA binding protein YcfA (HicA-like mRNA interferase family)